MASLSFAVLFSVLYLYNIVVMHNGFNTNVPYKGKMYHVQTEDGGARNPVLTTMLYHKGEILATEKSSYAEVLVDDDWKEKVLEKIIATIPVGRLGDPDDIARGVLFLVADNAGFITGSTVDINGGQHMY